MANETPKDKNLIDEMKGAKGGDFEVEKHLTDKELEAVNGGLAGGCLCKCGVLFSCSGGGGGGSSSLE